MFRLTIPLLFALLTYSSLVLGTDEYFRCTRTVTGSGQCPSYLVHNATHCKSVYRPCGDRYVANLNGDEICKYQDYKKIITNGVGEYVPCVVEKGVSILPVHYVTKQKTSQGECLATKFNMYGGFRLDSITGNRSFVPASLQLNQEVEIDGILKTVFEWFYTAINHLEQSDEKVEDGNFQEADTDNLKAQSICAFLNQINENRPPTYWHVENFESRQLPLKGITTICFEDLYPSPGDADYNDFCFIMKLNEVFDDAGNLLLIDVVVTPRSRGAGYDHSLMLVLDGKPDNQQLSNAITTAVINGSYVAKVDQFDKYGILTRSESYQNGVDINVFPSTRQALPQWNSRPNEACGLPQKSYVTIMVEQPELNRMETRVVPGAPNYRPVLHVLNTGKYIDVVNVNKQFVDRNGYPFGIVVPIKWKWPKEQTKVYLAYPLFEQYRQCLLATEQDPCYKDEAVQHWFNNISSSDYIYDIDSMTCI